MRSRAAPLRWHGLTLIEMLVTLVIVALVAAILAQALQQLARVERLLEGGQLRSVAEGLRADWVRSALDSLVPGTVEGERLQGDERELQGYSTDVPARPAAGLALLRLRFRTDNTSRTTQLELLPAARGFEDVPPVILLSWAGTAGRFRYLDQQGQWSERWPPALATGALAPRAPAPQRLPRLIVLETGLDGQHLVVASPHASAQALPTRAQGEAM